MKKETYLLLLFLFAFGYFKNVLTNAFITRDITFVITMSWIFFGLYKFKPDFQNVLNTKRNRRVVWLLLGCLLISPINPLITWDQPYFNTQLSQRFNYVILFLLVLIRMQPSFDELEKPIKICSYITLLFYIISIYKPDFFLDPDILSDKMDRRINSDSTDIGFSVPGFRLAVLYLFIILWKITNKDSTKLDVLEVILFLALVFFRQNRSSIIGVAPMLIYSLFKYNGKYKFAFYFTLAIIMLSLMPLMSNILGSLVEETQTQLNDDSYDRWLSLNYFGIEGKKNFLDILIGNGTWSFDGAYKLEILKQGSHCQISDVGLIGTYYLYGIVPILIMFYFCWQSFNNKNVPLFLKGCFLWYIIVPTIHCFMQMNVGEDILIMISFYLVIYFSNLNKMHN